MGGSCAQAEKPEIQESGRPEGLPRTAAMTRVSGHKNAPAIVGGRLCACILPGSQARSLILQRQGETRFAAEKEQPPNRRHLCPCPPPQTPRYYPVNTGMPYQPTSITPRPFTRTKKRLRTGRRFSFCRNITWQLACHWSSFFVDDCEEYSRLSSALGASGRLPGVNIWVCKSLASMPATPCTPRVRLTACSHCL